MKLTLWTLVWCLCLAAAGCTKDSVEETDTGMVIRPADDVGQATEDASADVGQQAPDLPTEVGGDDSDGDGVPDDEDQFPDDPTESRDTDMDGVGDNADACPMDPDGSVDTDGDGVCDNSDDFPNDPTEQHDTDGDGLGDNVDDDDDGDGLGDLEETEFGTDCLRSDPLRPDSDGDGVLDPDDPYPLEPYPEFMLRQNEQGSIDLFLSNRDRTFGAATQIGEPIDHMGVPLEYVGYRIGDFDTNGKIDFLAHSTPLTADSPTRNVYFFWRDAKADAFKQRLVGTSDEVLGNIVMDANADNMFDLVRFDYVRPPGQYVTSASITVFLNNGQTGEAPCVWSDAATDGCMFVRLPAMDVTSAVGGQWVTVAARQAVDVNQDGRDDLTIVSYASGGNSATDVYTLLGNGDGTFQAPTLAFVHNASLSQAPANTVLFADFDNDSIGDVTLGFDDDGAPGSAWTYLGNGAGGFSMTAIEAIDLNPTDAYEVSGTEALGRTQSGRTFDFDFDGNMDLLVGYEHQNYGAAGETRFYAGNGDGTFDPTPTVIGAPTIYAHRFEIPQRLCPEFRLTSP